MNVVDSSGWIEYLLDSNRADLFAPAIENTQLLVVPSICFYEVTRYIHRNASPVLMGLAEAVMRRGHVVAWTDARAVQTAVIATRHKLALADAMVYACALEHGATLWTQDVDYADLPSVKLFPKAP